MEQTSFAFALKIGALLIVLVIWMRYRYVLNENARAFQRAQARRSGHDSHGGFEKLKTQRSQANRKALGERQARANVPTPWGWPDHQHAKSGRRGSSATASWIDGLVQGKRLRSSLDKDSNLVHSMRVLLQDRTPTTPQGHYKPPRTAS